MQIVKLDQGSPEWHAHRAQHWNAGDAPAMLGCSPNETRDQLIRRLATGIDQDVGRWTQRVFDDGHRAEELARPLAEHIIEEDLMRVVGVNGRYSASFDGRTMFGETAWEHKSVNDDIRAALGGVDGLDGLSALNEHDASIGKTLPLHYRVQMEHQLLVSAETNCILFTASKWNDDGTLEEVYHCWYESDPALRERIIRGWELLEADIKAYKPAPVAVEVVGHAPAMLPTLIINVTGAVTSSNLAEFHAAAVATIEAAGAHALVNDQDFADAELTVKWAADAEARIAEAKRAALAQTQSIDKLFQALDDIAGRLRSMRLAREKAIKTEKDVRREAIVGAAYQRLSDHIRELNAKLGRPLIKNPARHIIAEAIKNKRNLSSITDAANTAAASAMIDASAQAEKLASNLEAIEAAGLPSLFPDIATIAHKAPEDLASLISMRVANFRAEEAAAQARRQQQQEAQTVLNRAIVAPVMPAQVAVAAETPAQVGAGETLRLGQINERIAPVQINADGLAAFGFLPVATEKAAKLYRAADFRAICAALVKHLQDL